MSGSQRWDLLDGLTDAQQQAVVGSTRLRRYSARENLFNEGDEGDSLHLIAKGRVAIRALTPAGDTATFAILGPGQAIGEMALLRRSGTRSAGAMALEPAETRSLHRKDFFRLCNEHPAVERVLVHLLAARVDRLSHHLMDALYRPVDERIVRRLLETLRLYPDAGDGIVLPLTQQDIASLAGTTRPTANMVLNELQAAGIVTLTRGKIVVDNLKELASRAG